MLTEACAAYLDSDRNAPADAGHLRAGDPGDVTFRHESRVTSPPIPVQNVIFPPLWALAKIFGVHP
jgi:hypothetical protein